MKKLILPIISGLLILAAVTLGISAAIEYRNEEKAKNKNVVIEAFWQCDNNTVMIAARGTYPEPVSAKYELFADMNNNNVLDQQDRKIGFAVALTLDVTAVHLSQPIKVDNELLDRKIFIRLTTKSKDTAVAEAQCSHIKSIFKEEM
jgi:hypothetical protein